VIRVGAHLQRPVVDVAGASERLGKLALLRLRRIAAVAVCSAYLHLLETNCPAANLLRALACEFAHSQRESPCIPALKGEGLLLSRAHSIL